LSPERDRHFALSAPVQAFVGKDSVAELLELLELRILLSDSQAVLASLAAEDCRLPAPDPVRRLIPPLQVADAPFIPPDTLSIGASIEEVLLFMRRTARLAAEVAGASFASDGHVCANAPSPFFSSKAGSLQALESEVLPPRAESLLLKPSRARRTFCSDSPMWGK